MWGQPPSAVRRAKLGCVSNSRLSGEVLRTEFLRKNLITGKVNIRVVQHLRGIDWKAVTPRWMGPCACTG